ncbi:MAG TPA: AMP-binding protein, partial [Terriglobia bacterium]|nr:AMP-binding protein [Terriglobia bacterium]
MLNEDGGILIRDSYAQSSTGVSTLPGMLLHSADQYRKSDAFKFKRNGQWIHVATDEFLLRVEELSFALLALGVKTGDRLAIISENRLEWAAADYAGLCIGATIVPIYPTLAAPQVEALIRDSEPVLVFVSTAELLQRLCAVRQGLAVRYIVAFEPGLDQPGVMRLDALYEMGRRATYDYPGEFRRMACSANPDQVATIIYTSGTTGIPKGAMLTHGNLISNILSTSDRLPLGLADVSLSFLPLSH